MSCLMDERNVDDFDTNIETRLKEGTVYCANLLNEVSYSVFDNHVTKFSWL